MRFPIGEGDVLCIDWDERSLRVVEASASRGGVKVRSAVRVPMEAPLDNTAALGEFLRRTLAEHRVALEGMLLKPNMVLSGKECPQQASVQEVAEATVRCMKRVVPAAVPGDRAVLLHYCRVHCIWPDGSRPDSGEPSRPEVSAA